MTHIPEKWSVADAGVHTGADSDPKPGGKEQPRGMDLVFKSNMALIGGAIFNFTELYAAVLYLLGTVR